MTPEQVQELRKWALHNASLSASARVVALCDDWLRQQGELDFLYKDHGSLLARAEKAEAALRDGWVKVADLWVTVSPSLSEEQRAQGLGALAAVAAALAVPGETP